MFSSVNLSVSYQSINRSYSPPPPSPPSLIQSHRASYLRPSHLHPSSHRSYHTLHRAPSIRACTSGKRHSFLLTGRIRARPSPSKVFYSNMRLLFSMYLFLKPFNSMGGPCLSHSLEQTYRVEREHPPPQPPLPGGAPCTRQTYYQVNGGGQEGPLHWGVIRNLGPLPPSPPPGPTSTEIVNINLATYFPHYQFMSFDILWPLLPLLLPCSR